MKKITITTIIIFSIGISTAPVYGHKLIEHDDTHRDFESALQIPDHRISWAIYENLGPGEAKFYSFEAKHGDSFYASIVVPKITGLENYSPTIVLMGPGMFEGNVIPFKTQYGAEKFLYSGNFPGQEFYEPFGQVTYWERQEVRMNMPLDGQYYIVIYDEKNQTGKYSLVIGTIEDFTGGDIFTLLPKAWLDTKLFVNDYASIALFILILISIPTVPILVLVRKTKKKGASKNVSTFN